MNDDDLRIMSFLMKKCIIVVSPKYVNSSIGNYGINGTIYVPTHSQFFDSNVRQVSTMVKMFPISISKEFELSFKNESNNDNSLVALNVSHLLSIGKLCLILHENNHYKAFILSDITISECTQQRTPWPTSVSLNHWKSSTCDTSLCPICKKSNDDTFIQCDLCKYWIHKYCMSDFYNTNTITDKDEHFLCKICIEKVNYRFETYYSSRQGDKHFVPWFFSFNVLNETCKMRDILIKIKRKN